MEEAVENRNYLAKRMTEEIMEIINVLEDCARADESGSKMTSHGITNSGGLYSHVGQKSLRLMCIGQQGDFRSKQKPKLDRLLHIHSFSYFSYFYVVKKQN